MTRVLLAVVLSAALAVPAAAQGKSQAAHGPKRAFTVERGHAVEVTRDVLVHQGYEVVSVETVGNDQVITYRRGNMGRGKGKGPPMKMVVRQMGPHVVFVDTPDPILVDINLRLH
jgi:hypothetical protein